MGIIPSRNPWQRRTIPVQEDLPCVYCGYNLRGLALSGRCPECGGSNWDALLAPRYPHPSLRPEPHQHLLSHACRLATGPRCADRFCPPTSKATPLACIVLLLANALCIAVGGCCLGLDANRAVLAWQQGAGTHPRPERTRLYRHHRRGYLYDHAGHRAPRPAPAPPQPHPRAWASPVMLSSRSHPAN